MNIKRILMICCLLLILCPGVTLAGEEPIIYTVKQGDTLWDISQRFIKDPYYWPNLWSHNPDVGNPHLIYPGQKLRIIDGRIEIIPVDGEGQPVDDEISITLERAELVSTQGGARSFISTEEYDTLGTLIDTVENRLIMGDHDPVFLQFKDLSAVSVGDIYELIVTGEEIIHPVFNTPYGYRVEHLGTAEIIEVTPSVAVAKIKTINREIFRGSKVRPFIEPARQIAVNRPDKSITGFVLTGDMDRLNMGRDYHIHLDIGSENGLTVGNVLRITRPREWTGTAKALAEKENIIVTQLPVVELGEAVVTSVLPRSSTALIVKMGNVAIEPGDRVSTKKY